MADERYGYEEDEEQPRGGDHLFLWTIFILLLIGVAFACWLGSFYIFGHPENPRAYRFLQRLKKIEAPKRFEVTAAPPGEFMTAQKLFERYSAKKVLELEHENADLLRDFIKNYRETKKLVPYVTGRFNILQTYALTPGDTFTSGVVTLAQSVDFPQTLIEHVYTAPAENVAALRQMLATGLDMTLKRTDDCAAVIHIDKSADGRLKFTVVSLLYGTYAVKQGSGAFSLEPPPDVHIESGLPIIKAPELAKALRAYADYRHHHPAANAATAAVAVPKRVPELVRVGTAEIPEKSAPPPPATPRPTPPVVAMVATPIPVATPLATATPNPARTTASGVPLTPFNSGGEVVSRPDPSKMPATGASWRTYAPGQAPPGRTLTPDDVGALAGSGMINERLYLRGSFRVTATGVNRAVLRDATKPDEQSPRIVVEYPAGAVPPQEKELFERDATRPYQVQDVRRGADGVVTIYAREITQ